MGKGTYMAWPCDYPGAWAHFWLESVGYRDATRFNADSDPDYFCTHLISKGHVRLRTGNGVEIVLGPDDLFSMWPHISWRIQAEPPDKGEDVRIDWVRLRGPGAREFMQMLGTTEDQPWGRALDPQKTLSIMRGLQKLTKDYPQQADLTAIAQLHELAAACAKHSPSEHDDRTGAHRILEAMNQHLGSGMNVEDYARAFRISRSNLFLIFKKNFGKSPIQVLNEIRISRAKKLLKESDLSISEVAFASGFRDPLYFSRLFRQRVGKAPRDFRK